MEENETQRKVREFKADLKRRLDEGSFILNDDINHDLWLEDIDPDDGDERRDEAGIDPRDTYVPKLDERDDYPVGDENYSQNTMDTYLGAEVNMPEVDGYRRAVVRKSKRD